jgi:hypothetical protein
VTIERNECMPCALAHEATSVLAKIIVIGAKAQTILQHLNPDIPARLCRSGGNVRAMKTSILRNIG